MNTVYSERLITAMSHAARWHRYQVRKGTTIPYISHPMRVCSTVLEDGGTEDEACAALLHDAVEDTEATLDDVAWLFGPNVARIVCLCSDDEGRSDKKPPWRKRKEDHFEHLRHDPGFDVSVARVMAADKLANLTSQLDDHAALGQESWDRFKGGIAGTLWYLETATALIAQKLGTTSRLPGHLEAGLVRLRTIRDDTGVGLEGLDTSVAAALNSLDDRGLPGWTPTAVELAAFEIARQIRFRGVHPGAATVRVLTNWFEPLSEDPEEREEQLKLAVEGFAAAVKGVEGVVP